MNSILFKWLVVPWSNRTKRVQVAQLWEVRWRSRHGEYHSDTRPEVEAFTSPEEAAAFADSLRKAFALIRHSSGHRVDVSKAA